MLENPQKFLQTLPNKPGVYQMVDSNGRVLYVGKAKNLKKRLQSYFRTTNVSKTKVFMSKVKNIEIIVTSNENDAWLLESNLIKRAKPRYNILFKDDKSFPYLVLSNHSFPRLSVYRGRVDKKLGKFFGPFPDGWAVNFVLDLVQKVFQLRTCKDGSMKNRARPCMLQQIKLCSAPCKNHIDQARYALQVDLVKKFLSGKNDQVVKELARLMDEAAAKLEYEKAADYRDQIASIRKIQTEQVVTKDGGNIDVVAIVKKEGRVAVNILFVRNGLIVGNKNYLPKVYDITETLEEIMLSFIRDHYLQTKDEALLPDKIFLNLKLSQKISGLRIFYQARGWSKKLLKMAEDNALNSIKSHKESSHAFAQCLLDFKKVFSLSVIPQRIECFDVSHTMGEAEIASCVVFDESGFNKKEYRRFNIKTTAKGDDYQALREALSRRFSFTDIMPEVVVIDGGVGQLKVAAQVFKRLKIKNIKLISVAKGKTRKPGLEKIYVGEKGIPMNLPSNSQAFYFIQQIRDEAHRFAISSHREKMRKTRVRSELENILGVGKSKRSLLLKHFGGLNELQSVGVDDLVRVKGIGFVLAKRIYEHLHA